jgi:hypothetical protein
MRTSPQIHNRLTLGKLKQAEAVGSSHSEHMLKTEEELRRWLTTVDVEATGETPLHRLVALKSPPVQITDMPPLPPLKPTPPMLQQQPVQLLRAPVAPAPAAEATPQPPASFTLSAEQLQALIAQALMGQSGTQPTAAPVALPGGSNASV